MKFVSWKLLLVFLIAFAKKSNALEKELTINIDPFKQDCFYQSVKQGDTIDVEYQVIDGGHGDFDITFNLVEPGGRILVADFKKSENNHRVDAKTTGDYKFCFDNSFSSYNAKTVFFELVIEGVNESEWGSDENIEFQGVAGEEVFELKIQDVQEMVNSVRNQLNKVRHIQDLIKSTEARDRNTAEEMFFRVNTFSIITLVIMAIVGFIQIIMVKSLFDDKSRIHNIWKHLNMDR